MASVAAHMMRVQDKLMPELSQIQVPTLICSGTDDKLTAVSGDRNLLYFRSANVPFPVLS